MAMTDEQRLALNNALNPGIQLALPQTVVPVVKNQHQVSSTQYNPEKLQALVSALTSPRAKQQIEKNKWEMLSNALASNISSPEFEGAYGIKFTNPYLDALSSGVNVFNSLYSAQQQQARDLANQDVELQNLAREDAIKAAQLEAEATKQAVQNTRTEDYIKINDPNAKGNEQQQAMAQLDLLENKLEDIGTRYDDDFKDIDDMEKRLTKADTASVGALWGAGRTSKEKQAERDFASWQRNMQNVLVNANRKAGSGTMSDADAERYEQGIAQAKDLPEARTILRDFKARMNASSVVQQPQTNAQMTTDDIWKMLDRQ